MQIEFEGFIQFFICVLCSFYVFCVFLSLESSGTRHSYSGSAAILDQALDGVLLLGAIVF